MRTAQDVYDKPIPGDSAERKFKTQETQKKTVGAWDAQVEGFVQYTDEDLIIRWMNIERWRKWIKRATITHIAQPGGER